MIACKLADILKKKSWSIYRLRKESGVSYPTLLGLYHNRSRMYRADVLDKLCRALRCQPGELLASSAAVQRPARARKN
jgi:DNA-binding Xre family transcriptional regulator